MALFCIGNGGLPFIQRECVYNQFYSDLITPLNDNIVVPSTTIHCFYASKMGKEYLQRYQRHFKNPVIHCKDMLHEELLVSHPKEWSEEERRNCIQIFRERIHVLRWYDHLFHDSGRCSLQSCLDYSANMMATA